MSHGPRIRPEVKDMIWDEAIARPKTPRDDLAVELQGSIRQMGYPVPEVETLQKMISKARNSRTPSPEDEPWHLGCLDKYEVPPEALPALIEKWKLQLAIGEPLTIRQAKWFVRLQPLSQDGARLSGWANQYVRREITSESQKRPLDTSDLDVSLTMGLWEAAAARLTGRGALPRSMVPILHPIPYSASSFDNALDAARSQVMIWTIRVIHEVIGGIPRFDIRELLEESNRTIERCRQAFAPSPEAPWVFLYWLTHLAQGPKWQSLPPRRVKAILDQLITWISKQVSKMPDPGKPEPADVLHEYTLLTTPGLRPTRLLKAVGYEVSQPSSYMDYLGFAEKVGGTRFRVYVPKEKEEE